MKKYNAPKLYVDEYVADTMIASITGSPKNGNAGNNQNCSGCNESAGVTDPNNPENMCVVIKGTPAYAQWCE